MRKIKHKNAQTVRTQSLFLILNAAINRPRIIPHRQGGNLPYRRRRRAQSPSVTSQRTPHKTHTVNFKQVYAPAEHSNENHKSRTSQAAGREPRFLKRKCRKMRCPGHLPLKRRYIKYRRLSKTRGDMKKQYLHYDALVT